MRKLLFSIFIFSLTIGTCNAHILKKNTSGKAEIDLFGRSFGNKKSPKAKEPRSVLKAKRKQEAKEKKRDSDYEKLIKKSQKRTFDIQTPEVQARMKQNKKDYTTRDKAKKKRVKAITKKAGKKYK